jgi:hypothetical protein
VVVCVAGHRAGAVLPVHGLLPISVAMIPLDLSLVSFSLPVCFTPVIFSYHLLKSWDSDLDQ